MDDRRIQNPDIDSIFIEFGFENSNPPTSDYVNVDSKGRFVVRQFLENNSPEGYSFHFHVALVNEGGSPQRVPLKIIWAENEYDYCRDYMYVGYDSGKEWKMLSISCHDAVTELTVVVPVGRHLLCCSPKFDYTDYQTFLSNYAGKHMVEKVDVAATPMGNLISCLKVGNPGGKQVLITTRAHGYETAGAYCLTGWLDELTENPERNAPILDSVCCHIFPMINPDGVSTGNCCLAPGGLNFGNKLGINYRNDSGAAKLTEYIFRLKPDFYLDMHNNSGPHHVDSFRTCHLNLGDMFREKALDSSRDQKVWVVSQTALPDGYLLKVCHDRFGTVPITTEFPWYTRLPEDMKRHGREFFKTLINLFKNSIF